MNIIRGIEVNINKRLVDAFIAKYSLRSINSRTLHVADRSGDRLQQVSNHSRGDRAVGVEDRRKRSRKRDVSSRMLVRQSEEKLSDLPRLLAVCLHQSVRVGRAVRRLFRICKFN